MLRTPLSIEYIIQIRLPWGCLLPPEHTTAPQSASMWAQDASFWSPTIFGHLSLGTSWIYDLLHNGQDLLAWLGVAYRGTTTNEIGQATLLIITEKPTVQPNCCTMLCFPGALFWSVDLGTPYSLQALWMLISPTELLLQHWLTHFLITVAAVCGWAIRDWRAGGYNRSPARELYHTCFQGPCLAIKEWHWGSHHCRERILFSS